MLDAQKMENGGLEIMNMDWVLGNIVTEIIRLSKGDTFLDSCSRHEHSKALGMMISPKISSS